MIHLCTETIGIFNNQICYHGNCRCHATFLGDSSSSKQIAAIVCPHPFRTVDVAVGVAVALYPSAVVEI